MSRLIDKEQLAEKHPAFKKKNRLEWLLRYGRISFVKISRSKYFDEEQIDKWIKENSFNKLCDQ